MMKQSFYLTAFAVLALTATSCDNNIETEQFIEAPSIALKNTAGFCVLASSGGTTTISFSANGNWSAELIGEEEKDWIIVSPQKGSAGDITLTLTALENNSLYNRQATLHLMNDTVSVDVSVGQPARQYEVLMELYDRKYKLN